MDFFRDSFKKVQFRRRFTARDDEKLKRLVKKHGAGNWNAIAQHMPGRNARQVHERYINYLSPDLNKDPWTKEEEELLLAKHDELGNKWKSISAFFTNRTDIALKCRYHQLMKKMAKEGQVLDEYKLEKRILSKAMAFENSAGTSNEMCRDDSFFNATDSFLDDIDIVFNEKTFSGVYRECEWF